MPRGYINTLNVIYILLNLVSAKSSILLEMLCLSDIWVKFRKAGRYRNFKTIWKNLILVLCHASG